MTQLADSVVQKKEALYELAEIGETFGPIELVVDDFKIKRFAFTQDDYRPWHFGESPFGGRIGHAAILANDLLQLYHLNYAEYGASQTAGLHTGEELRFHAPVRDGERVTLQGRYVDKYLRRGKGYVVMEAEARGEDGRLLVSHRGVEIMRVAAGSVVGKQSSEASGPQVTGDSDSSLAPVANAATGIRRGTPLEPLRKRAEPEHMAVYSMISPFSKNIHTDLEAASATGLHLPIMQGQQQVSYVSELLTGFFGASWFTSGWLNVKLINPVFAFDDLVVRGVVTGETAVEAGTQVDLEVWVENVDGAKTAVGWAHGLVAKR
ncbi:MaoC/PaaZ C-terminal domain-containing protein [Amycolatopsis sp. NPDC051372]|uniref:MaoC family dehydratase n=1 Tax=Amycolatopsis sp. NPDC051372 TaxID=3155669 RepID=UPI003435B47D